MDRFAAMNAFVNVAELRGFAPAARRLGLSPAAITRLVAALEAELSIRLLQRTTRSVALTDAGARYLERARRILAAVDDAERSARAEQSEPSGRFVVTAPLVFGRREVASLVSELMAKYPALHVELTLVDRMVSLVDEGVDVAVRIGALEDSSLRARSVGAVRRVLVASPSYVRERKRPRTPRDLKTHALIQFTGLSPTPEWRFVRDGEELRVPVTPKLVTNSADVAIAHAEQGGGIAMVLSYQVREQVRAGTLEVLLAKYEPLPYPIQLVYPGSRLPSANLRAFIELVLSTRDFRFVDL